MADNENTLPVPYRNHEDAEIRQEIFQLSITVEALAIGLEALVHSPAAANVKDELTVLLKFAKEACADIDSVVVLLAKTI